MRAIRDRLRLVYGVPLAKPHGHPIAELILTVLSQSTNDRNRDVAYLALRERFPSWEEVRDAPVDEIEEAIRPGGISKVKSARIKSILRAITDTAPQHGPSPVSDRALSLRLAGRPAGARRAALFDLAARGWPQDRGLRAAVRARDARRAGRHARLARGDAPRLFRPGAPFEEMHDEMLAITPPGEELELHLNLLRHGRRTCHARGPDCAGCALQKMCPSAFKVFT